MFPATTKDCNTPIVVGDLLLIPHAAEADAFAGESTVVLSLRRQNVPSAERRDDSSATRRPFQPREVSLATGSGW